MKRINFKFNNANNNKVTPFFKPQSKIIVNIDNTDDYDWGIIETETVNDIEKIIIDTENKIEELNKLEQQRGIIPPARDHFWYNQHILRGYAYTGINTDTQTVKTPEPKKEIIITPGKKFDSSKVEVIYGENIKYSKGFTGHHGHKKYKYGSYCFFEVTDNFGGCGVQQLFSWVHSYNDEHIIDLLKYSIDNIDKKVGIVLCQVGQDYFNSKFVQGLEELGFKYHEEYVNHYHGDGYKGRIYSLIIKK